MSQPPGIGLQTAHGPRLEAALIPLNSISYAMFPVTR